MWHFVPCHTTTDALGLAKLFLNVVVVRLHGCPAMIASNWRLQFAPTLLGEICNLSVIQGRMSTAFYPQTDGQAEWMNVSMEQYLWVHVNHQQDDSVKLLPIALYAINNGV